jgi:hypothetical protein
MSSISIGVAGLSVLVATCAGFIAFLQWRTAHIKVAIDLYDRRKAIVDHLSSLVRQMEEQHHPKEETIVEFMETTRDGRFLFGDDVANYLNEAAVAFVRLSERNTLVAEPKPGEQSVLVELGEWMYEGAPIFEEYHLRSDQIFGRYMRLDEPLPGWRTRRPRSYGRGSRILELIEQMPKMPKASE